MIEVYKYILNNIKIGKEIGKISLLITKLNNKDVAIFPGSKIYINKQELIAFLNETGFKIERIKTDRCEILTLSINNDKLLEEQKKYQK